MAHFFNYLQQTTQLAIWYLLSIFDHADTDQHKTAIELELTNKSSVFQKQIDEQHAVALAIWYLLFH
jgi:hypothetical protein